MIAVNFDTAKNNFENYCDRVSNCNDMIVITRDLERSVVILSIDRYNELILAEKELNKRLSQLVSSKDIILDVDSVETMLDNSINNSIKDKCEDNGAL